ncbi:MAG TPA: hypothetical protein VH277_05570, partial [Gemmatimonadaceae bacterium]|nr:hypothetical protein [Gemmatimonadaceae bacterium]
MHSLLPRVFRPPLLVAGLLAWGAAAAPAQTPAWCTTASMRSRVFHGCGVAASRDESVRQAYGEIARLMESRVQVNARSAQGLTRQLRKVNDRRGSASATYDSTAYEVQLQSSVVVQGVTQRQSASRGRVYTLVTYDAGPAIDRLEGAMAEAGAALLGGDLVAGVTRCVRAAALADSLPWLVGLASFEPDCRNIDALLDDGLHITLENDGAARVTFLDAPVSEVYLVARRDGADVQRGLGPSSVAGIVGLPAPTVLGEGRPVHESIDVDWDRLGIGVSIPFRARASRQLGSGTIALVATVGEEGDSLFRRSATSELQSRLHITVGGEPSATAAGTAAKAWRLVVSGTARDAPSVYGGERVASASVQWSVVDVRSGRQIGAGAVVGQRGTAGDQIGAREVAVHL